MRNAFWTTGAAIAAAALVLSSCSDTDEDSSPTDEAGTEVTDEAADSDTDTDNTDADADADDEADADGEAPAADGDTLTPEEISALLLEEGEFPLEFESFETLAETGADISAEAPADIPTIDDLGAAAVGLHSGFWAGAGENPLDVNMIQVGIVSYESLPEDAEAGFDLSESESADLEELGLGGLGMEGLEDEDIEYEIDAISHNGWEGAVVRMTMNFGGAAIDSETATLSRVAGETVLTVSAMGEGQEYLEEVADLQWEKFESGQ